jgi:hypothetical protein
MDSQQTQIITLSNVNGKGSALISVSLFSAAREMNLARARIFDGEPRYAPEREGKSI